MIQYLSSVCIFQHNDANQVRIEGVHLEDRNVIVNLELFDVKNYTKSTVYSGTHSLNVNHELYMFNPNMQSICLSEDKQQQFNIVIRQPNSPDEAFLGERLFLSMSDNF